MLEFMEVYTLNTWLFSRTGESCIFQSFRKNLCTIKLMSVWLIYCVTEGGFKTVTGARPTECPSSATHVINVKSIVPYSSQTAATGWNYSVQYNRDGTLTSSNICTDVTGDNLIVPGSLNVAGGVNYTPVTYAISTTLSSTDNVVFATGGTVLTLPAVATAGKSLQIIDTSGDATNNQIVIKTAIGDTINNLDASNGGAWINSNYQNCSLVSSGINSWYAFGQSGYGRLAAYLSTSYSTSSSAIVRYNSYSLNPSGMFSNPLFFTTGPTGTYYVNTCGKSQVWEVLAGVNVSIGGALTPNATLGLTINRVDATGNILQSEADSTIINGIGGTMATTVSKILKLSSGQGINIQITTNVAGNSIQFLTTTTKNFLSIRQIG